MHISMIYSIYIPRQNTPLFLFYSGSTPEYYFASSYVKLIMRHVMQCIAMIARLTLASLLLARI